MAPATIPAARALVGHPGDRYVRQPPMLNPGDLFTVTGRRYMTFEFGTNEHFAMKDGYCRWPRTRDDIANVPWAFPHCAVISAQPQERPHIRWNLERGSVVLVAGYGWYALDFAPNDNVKFVAL